MFYTSERRNPTHSEKIIAWENSGGKSNQVGKVLSKVECPYKYCLYPNSDMDWNNYGSDNNIQWVVDHIKPLAKNGNWDPRNLQAMHNRCNAQKSDTFPVY